MKKFVLALGLTTLVLAPAFAAGADFATTDANADSMVTMEEATTAGFTWTAEEFAAADKDANGSLSQEEFDAAAAMVK